MEASGTKVRYLNIGDPVAFGFKTPAHLIRPWPERRDGHNGYGPSAGILEAREVSRLKIRRRAGRSSRTACSSPRAPRKPSITLTALLDRDGEILVPMPTYPMYTAVIARIGARAVYYRTDPSRGWIPDLEHLQTLVTPATRAIVVIDPNNPTGASYPTPVRRAILEFAERHGLALVADEVYGDLGYEGGVAPLGSFNHDAPVISFSSLSKAYLAPGWRTGWLSIGRTPRLDDVAAAIRKLTDGRLCSTVPMQYAVAAALNGDKSHQVSFARR